MMSNTARPTRQAVGLPPKVVPTPPGWTASMRSPAGDAGQGEATAQGLGGHQDVGLDAPVLHGEPLARAAHAGLYLVGYQQDAVLVADTLELAHVLGGRYHEPAFAQYWLDYQRGYLFGVDILVKGLVQQAPRKRSRRRGS